MKMISRMFLTQHKERAFTQKTSHKKGNHGINSI